MWSESARRRAWSCSASLCCWWWRADGWRAALRRTAMNEARAIRRRRVTAISRHAVLLAFVLLALLPVYFMVVSAFKTKAEFIANQMGVPAQPTLASMKEALAGGDLYL